MKPTYRQEIDGLRAIAIIFIILSHFKQLNFVSGGVNIFFVISGYLITHILLNHQNNIFKFYKNRLLKLYPKIFIISIITLILFFFIGDFVQWTVFVRSFLTTITGIFNFYLIRIGDIYGQENYINPFLPFWAFCVIIQFYIIFPIVLKIIFFFTKKFNFNENFIIISLFTLSIVLFLLYFYFRNNIFFSFYSPLTRYWQFMLGACLYFAIQSKKRLYFDNLTIYLAVILIFIWQFNIELIYSWREVQVLLTISTLLFLYSTKKNIFNQILSLRPLTSLGKISYELYLIHMSVIYFISQLFEQDVVILSLILLIIITFLYNKFSNQNLQKKIIFVFSSKIIIFFSIFLIFINLGLYFYDKNLLIENEKKFKNLLSSINSIEKIKINFEKIFQNNDPTYKLLIGNEGYQCYNSKPLEDLLKNCSFSDISNSKNFFIIGGSQISSLGYDLKQRLKNYNYVHFSRGGLIYLPDFYKIDRIEDKRDEYFTKLNTLIRNTLLSVDKKSIILIGARYPLFLNKSYFDNNEGGIEGYEWNLKFEHIEDSELNWQDSFINSIEELSNNKNISVILIYPIPEAGWHVPKKLLKSFSKKLYLMKDYFDPENYLTTSYEIYKNRTKTSFELLDSINGDNIYRVYPHKLFCDTIINNRCLTHDDKNLFYADSNHTSLKGSEMINDLILEEIKKIELQSELNKN